MTGVEWKPGQGGRGVQGADQGLPRRDSFLGEPQIATPDPRYTFQTFVVGGNNRLAHAAALSVAERPGRTYNPLFLYGGVGLGKTHLLHAIWRHAMNADQERKIIYVDGEQFIAECTKATRERRLDEFREKYYTVAILLIDNIQLFLGEEQVQDEFFHLFNNLHGTNRQIVVTSDRASRSMLQLDHRLRSRFEWGLIADIAPPNLETRMAILRAKAGEQKVILTEDVSDLLAHRFPSGDIRELEGGVTRVIAYCQTKGIEINFDTAGEALAAITDRASDLRIFVEDIIAEVSKVFKIPVEQMRGPKRDGPIALARHVAMFLMREKTSLSLAAIGREMGGRDHSTAAHAFERIAAELVGNQRLLRQVEEVREKLRGVT